MKMWKSSRLIFKEACFHQGCRLAPFELWNARWNVSEISFSVEHFEKKGPFKQQKKGVNGINLLSITFKVGPIRFYCQLESGRDSLRLYLEQGLQCATVFNKTSVEASEEYKSKTSFPLKEKPLVLFFVLLL